MENIKYIDITQLPDDLWQDAKNLIALDKNGEVIKASKQDSYSKEEIDDLLKDAEISADKLQNKIKINSANTDYVVTQPTVSGDSLVITDSMSDKNQYHTFGYDKTIATTSHKLLDYSTPLFRGTNEYNCPQWDGNSIRFTNQAGMKLKTRLTIPYTYNGVKYVTHFDIDFGSQIYYLIFSVINDPNFPGYQSVKFKESEVYKAFGANGTFVFKSGNTIKDYAALSNTITSTYDFIYDGMNIEMTIGNFPLTASNGALIIETPRFYISENNVLMGDVPTERESSDHPERLSDYIRYANDVKAYILTDKNTKFKTINGQQITGDGNIEISTDIDLSNIATKAELATKQDTLVSGTNIKSINGTSLLSSGNMELATKEELNTKQDVITDLETIRSGAAKGATALQSVPSEYATEQWVNEQGFLKEHQDISNLATKAELSTKQDVINDLDSIRSGAAKGATALQSVPDTYALKSDILSAKTDSRYTTYDVQNPVLSGKTILLQNEVTDSRKYHTLGFDKTTTVISNGLLNYRTPLYRDSNEYNCPQWDGHSIRFTYQEGTEVYTTLKIPYTYNGIKYVTHLCINVYNDSVRMVPYPYSDDGNFPDYQIVPFKDSEIYNSHRSYGTLCIYINGEMQNYDSEPYSPDMFDAYVGPGDTVEIRVFDFPLTTPNGALIIETPRFYFSTNNVLMGDVPTEKESSDYPERLSDYIRYSNDVKAYILTDKNTTFKTINGEHITGNGNIEISTDVDLSNYYTKSQTNALVNPKLSQVTLTQAEYDALSTKENNVLYIISDASTTDSSDYYTKAEIDSMIGGASSTITEINNLVV